MITTAHADLIERLTKKVTLAGDARDEVVVKAPFTGQVLGTTPSGTEEDVEEAARRARGAQPAWAATSWRDRGKVLLRFHDTVLDRQEEILDLIQLESGKARRHAFEEVLDAALTSRYYANHGRAPIQSRRRKGALPLLTHTVEHHHPKGLIGFITPWNYPLVLGIGDALPALFAGNAVLIKPDRQTPFSTLWAVDVLEECGLPAEVAQVVTGSGAGLGEPIIERVDYVMFTGSTATGKVVAAQAASRLIGASMELGGKNAMIVLDDADLDKTVEGAVRACFSNGGQLCISMERLYVQDGLYEEFVQRFAERIKAMDVGPSLGYGPEMGSLVSESQLETVTDHVNEAVKEGATVLAGGKARPDLGPYFYEPTLLSGVTDSMTLCREETFGPVVSTYRFSTVDEAVEKANDSRYGLNASIWTKDGRKGRAIGARIEAGTVNVNEAYAAAWGSLDAPMGGFKESGMGRRHGAEGIRKYTDAQTVAQQRVVPIAPLPGMAVDKWARLMTRGLRLLKHLPGLR
jgi:succinate-semialdehyde dehydrogenase/glutarate-semialdehyde dehydrogenase